MDSLTKRFREEVFAPYLELLKAQYRFHPSFLRGKQVWEQKLTFEELVNGPYLERSLMYAQGDPLESLGLHEKTVATLRKKLGGRLLYKHQTDALKLLLAGKNAVIATGTSSGKTLCYQIPIIDDLLRDPLPGLRAIIIYPLNALVNDQLGEWEEMLKGHDQITFARFTGQTPDSKTEYESRLKEAIREQITDEELTQHELQRELERRLKEKLSKDPPNRLNHRDAIRAGSPQVLITNFSMLEYLLERPVDAPIFQNARLKFLVLDEAHAYRGVQATEIAFLIRRLKDRLGLDELVCVATSATLGRRDNDESTGKVRKFVSDLFGEPFDPPNPIYGAEEQPQLGHPSVHPKAVQYIKAVEALRDNPHADVRHTLSEHHSDLSLASLLEHDENLHRLRTQILTRPTRLSDAAERLWPNDPHAAEGLQALLEIVSASKLEGSSEDLLSTRLHYFVKAQDGLHSCLHKECPDRDGNNPAFFVSRKNDADTPEGYCPACHRLGRKSMLVEVVTCRKCGYLFGALQDLGPRRYQSHEEGSGTPKPYFDSFSTELGWAADSFWSYFNVERELPYPSQEQDDEEEDQDDLFLRPAELDWCLSCGKKRDQGAGDNCTCEHPHLRKIKIFHRQCPHFGKSNDLRNLSNQQKKPLTRCPNCGARNSSGLEPLRRFQESEDETGLAMAIPLSHFQVGMHRGEGKPPRKLLCFTDHRQRAAAFPALLEEETFAHDLGRKIVRIAHEREPLKLISLGERLADIADPQSENHDPDFFLPTSRFPDEELDAKGKRDLWVAEVFSYFGIPDSARESAEELGLIAVEYDLKEHERSAFHNKDSSYRDNFITDYLRRLLNLPPAEILNLAEKIWRFLIAESLLIEEKGKWKLDHERLFIAKQKARHVCGRCGIVVAYSVRQCCPRKGCDGRLETRPFDAARENIIARWVAGEGGPQFTGLKSEEHTAQINKDLAREIEEEFRSKGVNLLSSTTTFEMGINIGDLQKVLLRNAPPSSASYIQRVGRAGRGGDKNAIAVTLCRRTKYDADAWSNPPRLMSGEIRTPTVFLENRFIAQRHFNALMFAQFLRAKIADERLLGELKQKIRLEAFLLLLSRENIPENWFKVRPTNLYLDFLEWLGRQREADVFQIDAGRSLLFPLSGFDTGRENTAETYKKVLNEITEELIALMSERQKLFKQGGPTADIEQAVKNLLGSDVIEVLAKRGFLPRYAFPLDVVALETGWTRWSRDADVELSRDRGIAIAEFAPGAQVIARKKVFTSAGLYVVSSMDKPERRWYSRCPSCQQIRTSPTQEPLINSCSVCQRAITSQHIRPFVEPLAFSVRIDKKSEGGARHRRSTLIRQRQTLTHFIDSVEEGSFQDRGLFRIALKESGQLFRYNMGPANEGFILCPTCGYSEPMRGYKAGKKHKRLRALSGTMNCPNEQPWTKPVAYGHQFQSFCLIARTTVPPNSVESLAFALQKGLCNALEIELSDIGVSCRWLAKPTDMAGTEIIFYDRTPGGSGFAKEGYDRWAEVVDEARNVCRRCACERACYDCLKNYRNQSYHEKLDRFSVVELLSSAMGKGDKPCG